MGWVKGHYRKDGTYVRSHYRSSNNSTGYSGGGMDDSMKVVLSVVACFGLIFIVIVGLGLMVGQTPKHSPPVQTTSPVSSPETIASPNTQKSQKPGKPEKGMGLASLETEKTDDSGEKSPPTMSVDEQHRRLQQAIDEIEKDRTTRNTSPSENGGETANSVKRKSLINEDFGTPPGDQRSDSSDYGSYSGSGDVHVRGYYRKDGTYVRPHTRSRPSRH